MKLILETPPAAMLSSAANSTMTDSDRTRPFRLFRGALLLLAGGVLTAFGSACPPPGLAYLDINDDDNCVSVDVRPGAVPIEDQEEVIVDITDQGGARLVGTLRATPGAGPVNTVHLFVVDLTDTGFADATDRVLLTVDNNFEDRTDGGVGPLDFEMQLVPGLDGSYDSELVSGGGPGETRTDTFCATVQSVVGD